MCVIYLPLVALSELRLLRRHIGRYRLASAVELIMAVCGILRDLYPNMRSIVGVVLPTSHQGLHNFILQAVFQVYNYYLKELNF